MLLVFVIIYLVFSIIVGISSTVLVKNLRDYAVAGRSLPLPVVAATIFATWFGSESVIGIPPEFMDGGFSSIIEDPIGTFVCLILISVFFARRWYAGNFMTIGDFYRERYSRTVELLCSIAIVISYVGWAAAQLTAMGLVLNALSHGKISTLAGIAIGSTVVILYTVYGGMWSLAITDFIQMVIIIVGLIFISYHFFYQTGHMQTIHEILNYHAPGSAKHVLSWKSFISVSSALITSSLASIPQEDIFQRVISAKNFRIAQWGITLAAFMYMFIAVLPIFILYCGYKIAPQLAASDLNHQLLLPKIIMEHTPFSIQVMFFGALLSAIMSTASGSLLAPATILTKNIIQPYMGPLPDKKLLLATRLVVIVFGFIATLFSSISNDTIYNMVINSDEITLVIPLIPLIAGTHWKKANTPGAVMSISLGSIVFLGFSGNKTIGAVPPHVAGLFASILGMILGSYLSQLNSIRERINPKQN